MKKFSFTDSKPSIDFFAQNSLPISRRAKQGEPKRFDNSSLVLGERLELSRFMQPQGPKPCASASSATPAREAAIHLILRHSASSAGRSANFATVALLAL